MVERSQVSHKSCGSAGVRDIRSHEQKFDRDTLIDVLSSREDVSPADADRIQQETQKRLEVLKQQAKITAIETKKATIGAAW